MPDNILSLKRSDGDFPVYFYGSQDYYWINKSRAFLFLAGDNKKKISTNNNAKKLDLNFKNAIKETEIAFKRYSKYKKTVFQFKTTRSYIHLDCNEPFGDCQQANVDSTSKEMCECDELNSCSTDADCMNRLLMYECDSSICSNENSCKNRRFKKREYARIEKFESRTGYGLRALESIKKGQFVIEYVGELVNEQECSKRLSEMTARHDRNFYFLTLKKNVIIDAGPKGNLARFLNHSCNPNCQTQKWIVDNQERVGLFAKCDIAFGNELTFNYNLECRGDEKTKCLCGSENCSGFIGLRPGKIALALAEKQKEAKKRIKSSNNISTNSISSSNKVSDNLEVLPVAEKAKVKNVDRKKEIDEELRENRMKNNGFLMQDNQLIGASNIQLNAKNVEDNRQIQLNDNNSLDENSNEKLFDDLNNDLENFELFEEISNQEPIVSSSEINSLINIIDETITSDKTKEFKILLAKVPTYLIGIAKKNAEQTIADIVNHETNALKENRNKFINYDLSRRILANELKKEISTSKKRQLFNTISLTSEKRIEAKINKSSLAIYYESLNELDEFDYEPSIDEIDNFSDQLIGNKLKNIKNFSIQSSSRKPSIKVQMKQNSNKRKFSQPIDENDLPICTIDKPLNKTSINQQQNKVAPKVKEVSKGLKKRKLNSIDENSNRIDKLSANHQLNVKTKPISQLKNKLIASQVCSSLEKEEDNQSTNSLEQCSSIEIENKDDNELERTRQLLKTIESYNHVSNEIFVLEYNRVTGEPLIQIDPLISRSLKKHQKDALKFLYLNTVDCIKNLVKTNGKEGNGSILKQSTGIVLKKKSKNQFP